MSKKLSNSYRIDKVPSKSSRSIVFDALIKDIDMTQIPIKYVEEVIVYYQDGTSAGYNGSDLTDAIPMNKTLSFSKNNIFKKMKDVKVYLNTALIEKEINEQVERYLGRFC